MADWMPGASEGERKVDLLAAVPEWLVWCAASAAGAFALTAIARILGAVVDLETPGA